MFGDGRDAFRHPNIPKNYYDSLCRAFDNCWAEFRSCSVRTYNNDKQEVFCYHRGQAPVIGLYSRFMRFDAYHSADRRDSLYI